ncbi:MAG: hypothetical protein MUF64_15010 [Polyangiaceae bacterium]|jgi:hypothetical protein|nr:hypothetical protein [Polyangiaceae bacterium]
MDPGSNQVNRQRLIEMLASSVGNEKSQSLVEEALAALGHPKDALIPVPVAQRALARIAGGGGLVGTAARLASARLSVPPPSRPTSLPPPIDVVGALASALGSERARELVGAACKRLSLDPAKLAREQALRVLEVLSAEPGLPGVSARFVRARLLLPG